MDLEAAASQCTVLDTVAPTENSESDIPWCDVQLRTFKLSAQILEMRWCSSAIDGCHLACGARLISYKRPSVRMELPIILL